MFRKQTSVPKIIEFCIRVYASIFGCEGIRAYCLNLECVNIVGGFRLIGAGPRM